MRHKITYKLVDKLTGLDFKASIKRTTTPTEPQVIAPRYFTGSPVKFIEDLLSWIFLLILNVIDYILRFLVSLETLTDRIKTYVFTNLYWGRGSRFAFIQSIGLLLAILGTTILFVNQVFSYTQRINTYIQVRQSAIYAASKSQVKDAAVATVSIETLVQTKGYVSETKTYIVKRGDTLASIAKKFNVSIDTIKWANNLKSDFLKVGQKLRIPPGSGVLHRVKKGDTIASIAKKYKAAAQAIMEANFLDSDADLKPGMEIFVPNGTLPPPPKPKRTTRTYTRRTYTKPGRTYQSSPAGIPSYSSRYPKFLTWPVEGGGTLTQHYWYGHKAIDIANNAYTRRRYGGHPYILAAASGRVTFAGYVCNAYRCGYAYMINIDHGNGYSTLYAHLQPGSIMVKAGQYVRQGQRIARMGASGWAYGTHLHFEVARGNYPHRRVLLNPLYFFK